jgi:glycosyltransferase involved in cell wall biosynthesis
MTPTRIAAVLTHPTQYFSPWFRDLHARHPEIEFTAVYATAPDADRQGVGFGASFHWDVPLLDGYKSIVLRPSAAGDDVHSGCFFGIDAPLRRTLLDLKPDVALVFGWHSIFQIRALLLCRRLGVPTLYRGDTNLLQRPAGFKGSLWDLKARTLLSQGFNGYLAVGSRSRDYLKAMRVRGDRIFDSPHCIDNAYFARQAETARSSGDPKQRFGLEGKFVVLFVGKLDRHKRPGDLLSAIANLRGDWSALFVGTGPLERELQDEARRLNVDAKFVGFLNQSELGAAYAAADVLVLPSVAFAPPHHAETWGLVCNEALACGVPCVVSDGVGCGPDLVESGMTGDVFATGDVISLEAAFKRMRSSIEHGRPVAERCRAKADAHSFRRASAGLVDAAQAVTRRKAVNGAGIVACCGNMAFVGGLERQSFQALEVLRRSGRRVDVLVNDWARDDDPIEPHPIKRLANGIGARWHVGCNWHPLAVARSPIGFLRLTAEFARVSMHFVKVVQRVGAKSVFLPEFDSVLRNALGLIHLRRRGVKTVLRVGNVPPRKPWHEWLWRRVIAPLVDRFVANSEFGARRLRECRIPSAKIRCIKNAVAERTVVGDTEREAAAVVAAYRTLLCVGQIAPFKGSHLLLDALDRLIAEGRDLHVAFLGRRPDWPEEYVRYFRELEIRAGNGPLAGRVHFLGEVANVQFVMRKAWLLVAPILQEETFGNVVLEASTVGLPAVVTPRGGLIELVEHERTGYICEEADVDSLVAGINWFLADETRQETASKKCLADSKRDDWDYSRSRFESAWIALFDELETDPHVKKGANRMNMPSLRVVG